MTCRSEHLSFLVEECRRPRDRLFPSMLNWENFLWSDRIDSIAQSWMRSAVRTSLKGGRMLQRKAREKKNGLAVISRLQSPFFHVNPTVWVQVSLVIWFSMTYMMLHKETSWNETKLLMRIHEACFPQFFRCFFSREDCKTRSLLPASNVSKMRTEHFGREDDRMVVDLGRSVIFTLHCQCIGTVQSRRCTIAWFRKQAGPGFSPRILQNKQVQSRLFSYRTMVPLMWLPSFHARTKAVIRIIRNSLRHGIHRIFKVSALVGGRVGWLLDTKNIEYRKL